MITLSESAMPRRAPSFASKEQEISNITTKRRKISETALLFIFITPTIYKLLVVL